MLNSFVFSLDELEKLKNSKNSDINAQYNLALEEAKNAAENNIKLLAFGYYMTGQKEYLEKARAYMQKTADEEHWYSEEYDPTAYEGYDIRTALETHYRCVSMSEGLSLFGDLLEKDEFDRFVKAIYEKGIIPILEDWVLPGKRIHALDTMGHNFWAITISGCATALALLHDVLPPESAELLETAKAAIAAWFEYKGNPLNAKPAAVDNGGYYEGLNYWDFTLHEYLIFAAAHKRAFGVLPFDDTQILMKAADFILDFSYHSSNGVYYAPFGDADGDNALIAPVYMLRYGLDHSGLRRYVKQIKNTKGDYALLKLLVSCDIYGKTDGEYGALSACYDKIGWAVFKSSHEKDADMLCVKCGDTWNHAHADAGHFVLFRNGQSEINDSSVGKYSSPNYISYFTDSHAHNVLLFEGRGQDFRDNYKNHAHLPGRLLNFRDEEGFRSVVANATGPMSRYFRKHHRHFILLDGFVLIYDDVECYENGTVNYLLHAEDENCHRMLTQCEITEEKGFRVIRPGNKEEECAYLSFNRKTDDEGHVRFASILQLNPNLSYSFNESRPDWRLDIGEYTVYFNHRADGKVAHRNGIVIVGGYVTDALLLILKSGRPFAVVNGSIVRPANGGESPLESLYRITGRI